MRHSLTSLINLTNAHLPSSWSAVSEPYFSHVATLSSATKESVSCFHNKKYLKTLKETQAGACFIEQAYLNDLPSHTIPLITPTPYAAFAKIVLAFHPDSLTYIQEDKRALASIHPTSKIGENVTVGAFCVIEEGVEIGDNSTIGIHSVVKKNSYIGSYTQIEDHVTISHATLGNHVYVKSGARIGTSGFGFEMTEQGPVNFPQIGRVIIEDYVQIGANTCIDRGSLSHTVIKKGTRIDNLVQIAHNVKIGEYCIIVAQVGISGSTILENAVCAGGQAGISGHLHIGDHVQIAAQSGIMRDIEKNSVVGGSPSLPIRDWHRQTALLKQMLKKP